MKYLMQAGRILAITFLAEVIHGLLPLPIPASIYGLILLLVALQTGILRLEQVKDVADLLLEIMPVLFIPAAVGLLEVWPQLQPILLPAGVILLVTTVLVMVGTGWTAQWFIRKEGRK